MSASRREAAGREAGEIILQAPIAWAESDEEALRGAQEWKATMVDEHYTEPIHDPAERRSASAAF
ncbi:MAG TPA: hypothetical protein VN756_00415 [Solirubrobacterales bacterium]|nr:hypothetical protein [Solirubrobacterales bacterium]